MSKIWHAQNKFKYLYLNLVLFFFFILEALSNLWCAIYTHKSVCLRRWAPGTRALANGHSPLYMFCTVFSVQVMNESKGWGCSKGLRKLQKSKEFCELFLQARTSKLSWYPCSKKHFHKNDWSSDNFYAESGPLAFISSYHTKDIISNLIPVGGKKIEGHNFIIMYLLHHSLSTVLHTG